jgi:hypothetical protein
MIGVMADRSELKIKAELWKALTARMSREPAITAEPIVVLAACLDALAKDVGLYEPDHHVVAPSPAERAGLPEAASKVLTHYLGQGKSPLTSDNVRDGLYDVFAALADNSDKLNFIPSKSMSADQFLYTAQIYWNLERGGRRDRLPIHSGGKLSDGTTAKIKVPNANGDFATMVLKDRAAPTGDYKSSSGGFYSQGRHIAVLVAEHLHSRRGAPNAMEVGTIVKHTTARGVERSILWPKLAIPDPRGSDRQRRGRDAGQHGTADYRPSLESAVAETADRVGSPPNLHVATNRTETIHPVNFLSGAMLNPAEVGRYAVARRVDIDGDELAVDDVAARITAGETVGYLIAGAGEGKTTYLHALCSSLMSRAIVFRWRVTGQLDWQKLRNFRDEVASIDETASSHELPIVIVGELATKLAREQEDALIEIVQEIPSGFAATRTSIVLAGRPAWLNRIRHSVSTGHTMRLVPLCGAEAELLIKNLADAHVACSEDKGPAWTAAHFPNLGHFLAQPHASQVAVLRDGPSLVGSLLHAAYGREFIRRLTAEYAEDLEPAEQAAYLLVSFATSALGGISEELLESICHDADIERASAGSPWQRDLDRVHSARHEMIGKVVLEDKGAATASDISRMISHIVDAAESSPEALDLLFNSVRIFEESRSLVPEQKRKTEPQFRAAIRTGILENRESWERLERSIGPDPGEFLACAYVLHRLLPDEFGAGEKNEYLLARTERLLTLAESAATPGSPLADRARYHRIFVDRAARRIRGDVVDDLSDIKALLPMLGQTWPEAPFYAQVVSLGLATLKHCDLDEDESDQVAGAVLEAWQRLRVVGDPSFQLSMNYVHFLARDFFLWPVERRLSLWAAAWEFSRALANPDGDLACLLDAELVKLEKSSTREDAAALRARRRRVLSETVITGQTNAEVVFRFADLAPTDETVRRVVRQVGGQVAAAHYRTPRAMALHALAIVATSDGERLDHLRAAIAAYEQSIENRDDWSARGFLWRRALRELHVLAPDEASALEPRMAAAARKFRS